VKLAHFGTFDVDNFGDLLYPLILTNALRHHDTFDILRVSPTSHDVGYADNLKPLAVAEFFGGERVVDGIVIGGGNIIHLLPAKLEQYKNAGVRTHAYADLWLLPARCCDGATPIVWNAPGVPSAIIPEHRSLVRDALRRVDYVSVRDAGSRAGLREVLREEQIRVVPDSAWQLDVLWPSTSVLNAFTEWQGRFQSFAGALVSVHLNSRYTSSYSQDEIARFLDCLAEAKNASIVFLPLGRCHGDMEFSQSVASRMRAPGVLYSDPRSLKEVAGVIAASTLYVGSSMHGFIAAAAFGVPAVSVANPAMPKFRGLAELGIPTHLLTPDWKQGVSAATSLDRSAVLASFDEVHEGAKRRLAEHWRDLAGTLRAPGRRELHRGVFAPMREAVHVTRSEVLSGLLEHEMKVRNLEVHESLQTERDKRKKLEKAVATLEEQVVSLQQSNRGLSVSARRADRLRARAEQETQRLRNSVSWKITAPLRAAAALFPNTAHRAVTAIRATARFLVITRWRETDIAPAIEEVPMQYEVPDSALRAIQQRSSHANKTKPRMVIFTANFGSYDQLLVPHYIEPDCDYVCYTDVPKNNFGLWDIRASPYYHPDPTRIARYIKLHPHELLAEYDFAVWIDANVSLAQPVEALVRKLNVIGASLGMIPHPIRSCAFEEADACIALAKDDADTIRAQAAFYKSNGLERNQGLFETNCVVTKLDDRGVRQLYQRWWAQLDRYSRRDQLGLAWALASDYEDIPVATLMPKGVSVREHDGFVYFTHDRCRQLRMPQVLQELGQMVDPYDMRTYASAKQARVSARSGTTCAVIVCVHNALKDTKLCLDSLARHRCLGERLVLVNDQSDNETTGFLRSFAAEREWVHLIENSSNLGYVRSANSGLYATTEAFVVLLNSDTVVCENWLAKLVDIAFSGESIGIVGPLSNAAGAQSVPDIKRRHNNTAINELPAQVAICDVDHFLERASFADCFPVVPLVHGFCLGIKRSVLDAVGGFDDTNFERYYGEENDFVFRARAAGFTMAIATNVFVFHHKSRSISDSEREIHMQRSNAKLRELYGRERIVTAMTQMSEHPLLVRMRDEVAQYFDAASP